MFCQNCGKQLPDEARFCDTCGMPTNKETVPMQNGQGLYVNGRKPKKGGFKWQYIPLGVIGVLLAIAVAAGCFFAVRSMWKKLFASEVSRDDTVAADVQEKNESEKETGGRNISAEELAGVWEAEMPIELMMYVFSCFVEDLTDLTANEIGLGPFIGCRTDLGYTEATFKIELEFSADGEYVYLYPDMNSCVRGLQEYSADLYAYVQEKGADGITAYINQYYPQLAQYYWDYYNEHWTFDEESAQQMLEAIEQLEWSDEYDYFLGGETEGEAEFRLEKDKFILSDGGDITFEGGYVYDGKQIKMKEWKYDYEAALKNYTEEIGEELTEDELADLDKFADIENQFLQLFDGVILKRAAS